MSDYIPFIRTATRYDAAALARLGARSDRLRAHALLVEDAGETVAAIHLTSGKVFADWSRPTSEAIAALRRRRYELLRQGGAVRHARFALARPGRAPTAAPAAPGVLGHSRRLAGVAGL